MKNTLTKSKRSTLVLKAKAWKVYVNNYVFQEYPYFGSTENIEVVYASTKGQAKLKLGVDFEYDDFTEIRAVRSKMDDLYVVNGNTVTYEQILNYEKKQIEVNKRLKQLNKFPDDELFYIMQGYVGNCANFWRLGSAGKTTDLKYAQTYTKSEVKSCIDNLDLQFYPASFVQEHSNLTFDTQNLKENSYVR